MLHVTTVVFCKMTTTSPSQSFQVTHTRLITEKSFRGSKVGEVTFSEAEVYTSYVGCCGAVKGIRAVGTGRRPNHVICLLSSSFWCF